MESIGNLYLALGFMVITNELSELCIWNLEGPQTVKICTNYVWNIVYKSPITNTVTMQNFEVMPIQQQHQRQQSN